MNDYALGPDGRRKARVGLSSLAGASSSGGIRFLAAIDVNQWICAANP